MGVAPRDDLDRLIADMIADDIAERSRLVPGLSAGASAIVRAADGHTKEDIRAAVAFIAKHLAEDDARLSEGAA